ncbi:MAG: aromatic amino acid ammonia-lyase [Pseudomonadota bacterium]
MQLDGTRVTLRAFQAASQTAQPVSLDPAAEARVARAHRHVAEHAARGTPVYGLTTGLGANVDHRVPHADIAAFQRQILAGRAVACGEPVPESISRGAVLARLISASHGHSGISPSTLTHLLALHNAGLAPVMPGTGSIGAADLTQNAHAGLALLGEGELWDAGRRVDAASALAARNLTPPSLQPKDGLVLASHTGLTVSLAGHALHAARLATSMQKHAALLSYLGYEANPAVFDARVNALRPAPGQGAIAAWFRAALDGARIAPRRVQEALSFRTVAPVIGAALAALDTAVDTWEGELNASPDSPVVLDDGELLSSPNFVAPALALHLQSVLFATVAMANASVQRMQRMMDSTRSGLPQYLSPTGPPAAGWVPSQKTAVALLTRIAHCAQPAVLAGVPVSDAVEDVALMTAHSAEQLAAQATCFEHLVALEALVACQAIDLRGHTALGASGTALHATIRQRVPTLTVDRPLGGAIELARQALLDTADASVSTATHTPD